MSHLLAMSCMNEVSKYDARRLQATQNARQFSEQDADSAYNEWPLKNAPIWRATKIDRARDRAAPARSREGKNTHHQVRNDRLQPVAFLC